MKKPKNEAQEIIEHIDLLKAKLIEVFIPLTHHVPLDLAKKKKIKTKVDLIHNLLEHESLKALAIKNTAPLTAQWQMLAAQLSVLEKQITTNKTISEELLSRIIIYLQELQDTISSVLKVKVQGDTRTVEKIRKIMKR